MAKPKIRFKGYQDDWEQRKLGDVFEEYSEKGHKELPALTIIQGGGTLKREDSDRNLMYDESNLANYKMVHKDDFIVHLRSFEGGLEKSSLDGIISPAYHTFHSEEVDSRFYYSYFRSYEFIKHKLVPHVYGIRDGRSIDIEGMKSIEIPYTLRAEQKKIGDCLEVLDHLITLHQRKRLGWLKVGKNDWEQRKLSELTTMHARIGWQNLRTSEFLDNGEYMLITGTDFNDGAIDYSTCHYVEKERYDQDKNIQIHNGNILITKDGTLGKVAYVQGLTMPATLNAGVFNVEIKDENLADEKYLFQYLKAPFLMDYVSKKATGGTIKHLNQSILVDFPVAMPKKEEQAMIGDYFESLDHLITLHQRKCDESKKIKKFMLQKMFPQNGSLVPEIRFDGFTDDWEQRKVSEMFKVTRGYVLPATDASEEISDEMPYPVYSSQTKDNGLMGYYSDYLYEDAITWTTDGANAGTVNFRYGRFYCTNVCGVLLSNKVEASKAVAEALNNVAKRYVSYVGNPKLMNNVMADIQIKIPTSREERAKISSYFFTLDRLITLHQQK